VRFGNSAARSGGGDDAAAIVPAVLLSGGFWNRFQIPVVNLKAGLVQFSGGRQWMPLVRFARCTGPAESPSCTGRGSKRLPEPQAHGLFGRTCQRGKSRSFGLRRNIPAAQTAKLKLNQKRHIRLSVLNGDGFMNETDGRMVIPEVSRVFFFRRPGERFLRHSGSDTLENQLLVPSRRRFCRV
jgi:hypothetical protein